MPGMTPDRIAAQLWTVRSLITDGASLSRVLAGIKAIGYAAVQISGVPGAIPAAEIRQRCRQAGLAICATHEPARDICENPQKVIDRLGELGCRDTAYPFPHVPLADLASVERLAAQLDAAGAALRRAGLRLSYHNHDHEFVRVQGRSVLEWIFDLTAAAHLHAEPDTYWVQCGGADPAAWCSRFPRRLPLLHLKDYAVRLRDGNPERTQAELGQGQLDWPAIIAAAREAGCEWYIVEQDTCSGDPLDSLRISWDHLAAFLRRS